MLSSRIRASTSTLFTGERRTISVKPKLALFNGNAQTSRFDALTHFINSFSKRTISYMRAFTSLQLQRVESLKISVHSYSTEDDFSELGSVVTRGSRPVVKLMTEKLERFVKIDPARKASRKVSSGTSSPAKGRPKLKNIPLKHDSIINLSQLTGVISNSGKISNAYGRNVPNKLESCDVEFEKSLKSTGGATSAGGNTVEGTHLPIGPMHASGTVTIRISNISTDTTDPMIHSICKSIGPIEGLAREKLDEVDVSFTVKNNLAAQSILEQLDRKIVDDCRWSAYVSTEDSNSALMTSKEDTQWQLGDQVSSGIADLKRQFFGEYIEKKLYLEDLENLHMALVHLENHPDKNQLVIPR